MTRIANQLIPALLVATALLYAGSPPSLAQDGNSASRLEHAMETHSNDYLELNPLSATFRGDNRFDNRLPATFTDSHRA